MTSLVIVCSAPLNVVDVAVVIVGVAVSVPSCRPLTSTGGAVQMPPDGVAAGTLIVCPKASAIVTATLVTSGCDTPEKATGVATLASLTAERPNPVTPLRWIGGQPAAGAATGKRPMVSSLRPTRNTPSKFLALSALAASNGSSANLAVQVVGAGSSAVGGS